MTHFGILVGITACHVCSVVILYRCNSLSIRSGKMHATCVLERVSITYGYGPDIGQKMKVIMHASVYFGSARKTCER